MARDSKDIQESTTIPTTTDAIDVMDALDDQDEPWPTAFFTGQSLELIRLGWSREKLAPYQNPPHPSDEMWLVSTTAVGTMPSLEPKAYEI